MSSPEAPSYREAHARSLSDPESFWSEAAAGLAWTRRWSRVLDDSQAPFYRWFPGATLNTCYNALDRHVEAGRGEQTALIYDSAMLDRVRSYSYLELQREVAVTAGALRALGVESGDRVLIYMPMVPEALMTMLACARLGAIHSVVFGGFASKELATRIDDATPKVLVLASCGLEPGRTVEYKPLVDGALQVCRHQPERCVVLQREAAEAPLQGGRDIDWREFRAAAKPVSCVEVGATDPVYILYTSGTTGVPKGVVRDTGGHAVALHWSLQKVYGMRPGDVFWAASDIGWVVGHSYIVYAPLLLGCTTVLYEGKPVGTPDSGAFWRVVCEHKVNALFTAPTAIRAIKREDPGAERVADFDLSSLRTLFLAGERADPDTVRWAEKALGIPVIDHWWQTETGWPMAANCMGIEVLPVKRGSPTVAVPGFDVRVVDDEGQELARTDSSESEGGHIVVKLPLPPGSLPTLWNNDEGYKSSYLECFPGYYQTADAGRIDTDGYLWIMSRTDDVINVAGHRLSTGGLEEILSEHADVAECAVVGVHDALKGQTPLGLVVLNAGAERVERELVEELVADVRETLGPVAAFKRVCVVRRLPKTRSGKILRRTLRAIADGEEYVTPATIDDPLILEEIGEALRARGQAT
ncbi:MAG: propionyl-CoA synthetase [bacterium]|nr:propionyl-CoA synthetase [bacterium]